MTRHRKALGGLVLAAVLAGASACSSFSMSMKTVAISLPQAKYPVSMSPYLRGTLGVLEAKDYRVLGTYEYSAQSCPKEGAGDVDISDSLNEQIQQANGNAIVNLEMQVRSTSDCTDLIIRGDIVRARTSAL